MSGFAHLLGLTHGLAAALVSIGAFYLIGVLLLPRRWQTSLRWPDSIVVGLALFLLLCWIATSSRHIPRHLRRADFRRHPLGADSDQVRVAAVEADSASQESGDARVACHVRPHLCSCVPARSASSGPRRPRPCHQTGHSICSRTPDMQRQLLLFGTADVDFATFEYLRSPASAFLLAWHSLFYLGDPLNAAMPALLMVAALAGTITVRLVRSLFGLSWRAAMAVAAITVCAPDVSVGPDNVFARRVVVRDLGALPHRRHMQRRCRAFDQCCDSARHWRPERCCFSVRGQRSARPAASRAA